ncbi:tyrosine-type recombinase/integrase [Halopelagius longus]|uniref:Site-specific integrase n=1 Tax=Halopelagius longus TaxID=1236180 RepID=A0A1H0XPF9_9EURY|nr:tyrosine-type recombinase/integrase [Halopelagius longus]RDI71972.1 site-specific integrase [Halopelagius longus]SDQ04546.1 Site-specific recombinase XerD [Halopelagius longus]
MSSQQTQPEITQEQLLRAIQRENISEDLQSISPEEAIEFYFDDRSRDLAPNTKRVHRSALRFFKRWCSEQGIENLNDLTSRDLSKYRSWRRDEATTKVDSLSKSSEESQMNIIRSFIQVCERIDAVESGLHKDVPFPDMDEGDDVCLDEVSYERVSEILGYLREHEYAKRGHVVWEVMAETGLRTGAIHSLDICDYKTGKEQDYLRLRHRPESGTSLKNGAKSERYVAISDQVRTVIDDYLLENYPDAEEKYKDEYGREPLLSAGQGRICRSTLRKYVYMWTRPCEIGKECPHNRDKRNCEATDNDAASKCGSSKAPHTVRTGYITHLLGSGVNASCVSSRCDVTEDVMGTHYDTRDEYDKMVTRQQALKSTEPDDNGSNP